MADILEAAGREAGGTRSILRLIRSSPTTSPETSALRAEVEGLRLALSIARDALREERSDKEHWREEAKYLRRLLAGAKAKPEIVHVPDSETPQVIEGPALATAVETEPDHSTSELAAAALIAPARQFRWWGRLFANRGGQAARESA
jgi:hypothetical protein